jgi:hypothetical protein
MGHRGPVAGLVAALIVAFPAPALAGRGETKDSGGGTPSPTGDKKVEVRWNPAASVTVQPGESIDSVLDRLVAAMNAASGGEYVATHQEGAPVFDVLRANGEEIDDLALSEDDRAIQFTRISVNRPDLRARIRAPEQDPAGGTLIVMLNGRDVPVVTTDVPDTAALALEMEAAIRNAGFVVSFTPPYLVVTEDPQGGGLTTVGLRTTDPALTSSEIVLEPLAGAASTTETPAGPPEAAVPAAGPAALAALAVLLGVSAALILRRIPR